MLDIAGYAVAALMTLVAIWRALGGRDARRRSLWGCFLGFSIALWTKTEAVRIGLNNSAITDVSVLLKHYSAGAAILAIMYYIVAVYGDGDDARAVRVSRFIQRVAMKTALAAFTIMTVMFFTVVDRSKPSNHFVSDHAGQWGATAYMTVFYIYLGSASALCLYQWALAFRDEKRHLLRAGLGMMAFAMVLGVLYSFGRMFFMWGWLIEPPSYDFSHTVESTTETMQLLLFVFFALGVSVPACESGLRRARAWRALAQLHPMWSKVMAAFPDMPMEAPRPLREELTRRDIDVELRLDRWIHDLGDAIEKLRHYVPDDLMGAARQKATTQTRANNVAPLAEAYWVKAALAAKEQGVAPGPVAAFEQAQATDQDGETAWLRRVAREYQRAGDAEAKVLLDSVAVPA